MFFDCIKPRICCKDLIHPWIRCAWYDLAVCWEAKSIFYNLHLRGWVRAPLTACVWAVSVPLSCQSHLLCLQSQPGPGCCHPPPQDAGVGSQCWESNSTHWSGESAIFLEKSTQSYNRHLFSQHLCKYVNQILHATVPKMPPGLCPKNNIILLH